MDTGKNCRWGYHCHSGQHRPQHCGLGYETADFWGVVGSEHFEAIGENDYEDMQSRRMTSQKVKKLANSIMRVMMLGEISAVESAELLPEGALVTCDASDGQDIGCDGTH